jgi:mRNA-degrading endonuclease RelE of RelBE toxin-antitoxin system
VAQYKLSIKPSAGKELEAVGSKADRTRIAAKISALATNPRPHGCENYRVVYEIDDGASHVTIYKIGNRREVYR